MIFAITPQPPAITISRKDEVSDFCGVQDSGQHCSQPDTPLQNSPSLTQEVARTTPEFRSFASSFTLQKMASDSFNELKSYASFPPNWDGYRAPVFNIQTINITHSLLYQLVADLSREGFVPEDLFPGPASDGSIGIECIGPERSLFIVVGPSPQDPITIEEIVAGGVRKHVVPAGEMDLGRWTDWLVGKAPLPHSA